MQIQVDIDDELMKKALMVSDSPTVAAAIEEGLRMLICLSDRTRLEDMFGMFPDGFDEPDRN
jgi:hypothetical protein